ncbi:MAG: holo-ACP synthase [Lachnospiraceae bacterium]|nr:holo-ACP synthase [Lachnospiraceae bacterium]
MSDIVGIGVDIIEIERVTKAYKKESFRNKYFSEGERALIEKRIARCASAFAGKEAVVKALGTGFTGVSPADISILRDEKGTPIVKLTGGAQKLAKSLGVTEIKISLSDTQEQAIAYAIAIREYKSSGMGSSVQE